DDVAEDPCGDGSREQEINQRVVELREKAKGGMAASGGGKLVRACARKPARRLRAIETRRDRGNMRQRLGRGHRMKSGRGVCGRFEAARISASIVHPAAAPSFCFPMQASVSSATACASSAG